MRITFMVVLLPGAPPADRIATEQAAFVGASPMRPERRGIDAGDRIWFPSGVALAVIRSRCSPPHEGGSPDESASGLSLPGTGAAACGPARPPHPGTPH